MRDRFSIIRGSDRMLSVGFTGSGSVNRSMTFRPGLTHSMEDCSSVLDGGGESLERVESGNGLRNIGSSMKFDQDAFPLPRSLTGASLYSGHLFGESVTIRSMPAAA